MTLAENDIVSAQVVLRPAKKASGARPPTTADNLAEIEPARGAVAAAVNAFRSKGFDAGPFVGISFSITGLVADFERLLGVSLRRGAGGGIEFVIPGGHAASELSEDRLPVDLRPLVQAVVFPPPPAFGPTKF